MAETQLELFRRYAPTLSDITDETVELYLDDAELEVSRTIFGDLYDRAVVLYAAHLIDSRPAVAESSGGGTTVTVAGPITAQTDGRASRTYKDASASVSASDSSSVQMLGTPYGLQFQALLERCAAGPWPVTMGLD